MSIPESSIELTDEEQAEYERQRKELSDPRFHDYGKCGQPLELYFYRSRHTRYHRQKCIVHQVVVNMSGWEIGFFNGEDLRALKKK